jgi:hypothetical protein
MTAQRVQQRRIGIDRTDRRDLLGKAIRIGRFGFSVEPVPAAMRLELGLPLKSVPPSGAKWRKQSGV